MRGIVLALGLGIGLLVGALGVASALSEWWTPEGKNCPTFDSEESCKNYCRSNQDLCGGQVECGWHTGDQRPMC